MLEAELENNTIELETELDYRGPRGPKGDQGIPGPSNKLAIGEVFKGDTAKAEIIGDSPNQILNLTLPKGDTGDSGVFFGEDEPTDSNVNVWINPNGIPNGYVKNNEFQLKINEIKENIEEIKNDDTELREDLSQLKETSKLFSLISETGSKIDLSIDSNTFVMNLKLKDKNNNIISQGSIDLPIETMVVNASYNDENKTIALTLQNNQTIEFSVADLVRGLVSTEEFNKILLNYYSSSEIDEILKEYALKDEIPKKISDLENDSNFVKSTDYASTSKTGVIKSSNGMAVDSKNGNVFCVTSILANYKNAGSGTFISKGTLENIKDDYVGSSQPVKDLNTNLDNIIPKNSKKGTLVNIDDSLNYKTFETVVDGNSEQFTTTGKNKYDLNNLYGTERKGTWSGVTLNLKPNTSYTISTNMISNPGITPSIGKPVNTNAFIIVSVDSTETENELSSANNGLGTTDNVTKTVTTDSSGYMYIAKRNTANETIDNLISQGGFVQIEEGTVATDYELFTGGIKSPNPDYPQEIEVIEDSVEIVVCGRNLFDCKGKYYSEHGRNISIDSVNQIITVYGTGTKADGYNFLNNYQNFKPGRYTITVERISGRFTAYEQGATWAFLVYPFGSNFDNLTLTQNNMDKVQKTITITSDDIANVKECRLWFGWSSNSVSGKDGVFDNFKFRIQIERGSQATDYEPYQSSSLNITIPENEFAAKINDVKDQFRINFNEDDGKYHLYLDKMIGRKKLSVDGWKVRVGATKYAYILPNFFEINGSSGQCTHFKFVVKGASNAQNNECIASASNALGLNLYTNNEKLSTSEKLVTYLQENDVWIYYELENPYTLDLEIVEPLKTNHDINNFFVIANLETDIKVTYALDIKKYVDNKLANISNQILIKGSEI